MLVFCKTRHHYDSYADFWRLVDAAGIPTCYLDEIDTTDGHRTYVFTPINGEIQYIADRLPTRRCKLVWWNLERPEDATLATSLDKLDGKLDAIWVSDRTYAQLDPRFTYVPVAGHRDYGTRSAERLWDVCHLAYLWGRRQEAIESLRAQGVRVAPAAWGRADQDAIVAKSHLMLNMHQYAGMTTIAPIRFAIAASYGIPIVSEPFADLEAHALCLKVAELDELTGLWIPHALQYPRELAKEGDKLHQRLCVDTDFGREVQKAASLL